MKNASQLNCLPLKVYSKKLLETILKAQLLGSCCLLFPVGSLLFHLIPSSVWPVTLNSSSTGMTSHNACQVLFRNTQMGHFSRVQLCVSSCLETGLSHTVSSIWIVSDWLNKLWCSVDSILDDIISFAQALCLAEPLWAHATPSDQFGDSETNVNLHKAVKSVVICWMHGHTGLPDNEITNAIYVCAVYVNVMSGQDLGSDVCAFLHLSVLLWQDGQIKTVGRKLQVVKL